MATVHPSRRGLIPQDSRNVEERSRLRSRTPPDFHDGKNERRRSSSRGRSPRRDSGRKSPEYDAYQKPDDSVPWRNQQNMYPDRRYNQNRPNGGWDDSLKSRQERRDCMQLSIWPPSPKGPVRDISPVDRAHKRRKRDRSSSVTTSDNSSDGERRRRERKARKKREKEERRSHKKKRSRQPSTDDEFDRDSKRRSRSGSKTRRKSRFRSTDSNEDEWVEKRTSSGAFFSQPTVAVPKPSEMTKSNVLTAQDDFDEQIGPQPLTKTSTGKVDERSYGGALLRGEGSAMAAFLTEDTNARIPRRGEIGLTSDQIASYETAGYVMSGSRHRRMNAVRMRKENQVISAEEKRGILKLQKEERGRREELLRDEFKELVDERLKAASSKKM